MNDRQLAPACGRSGQVGITVAGQQHRLEEQDAGVPDRGRAAEQGQDHFGYEGLEEKCEEGAEESGEGDEKDHKLTETSLY